MNITSLDPKVVTNLPHLEPIGARELSFPLVSVVGIRHFLFPGNWISGEIDIHPGLGNEIKSIVGLGAIECVRDVVEFCEDPVVALHLLETFSAVVFSAVGLLVDQVIGVPAVPRRTVGVVGPGILFEPYECRVCAGSAVPVTAFVHEDRLCWKRHLSLLLPDYLDDFVRSSCLVRLVALSPPSPFFLFILTSLIYPHLISHSSPMKKLEDLATLQPSEGVKKADCCHKRSISQPSTN